MPSVHATSPLLPSPFLHPLSLLRLQEKVRGAEGVGCAGRTVFSPKQPTHGEPTHGACILIFCLLPEVEADIKRGSCNPVVVTLGPVRVVVIPGLDKLLWHFVITAAAPSRLREL